MKRKFRNLTARKRCKVFVCVIALVLAMGCPGMAYASGLSGLESSEGGLSGLTEEENENDSVVPDPEEILGEEAVSIQEDYAYSNSYICTAYMYAQPDDLIAFTESYLEAAEANGFTAEEETIEGYSAWTLTCTDGSYAIFIPDFDGQVLLLVENGMEFGEKQPEGYYLTMKRNGRELNATWDDKETSCTEVSRSTGTSKSFEISYYFSRAEITLFELRFPNYAQAGDEFYVTKDSLMDGLYLYTSEEGSLVFYDSSHHHQMENSNDYFCVKITDMYENSDGTVIEGIFEGSFNKGTTTYMDGSFRVLCDS
ncbi:MAG: hypothetical protein LIP12_11325 [Clostridiales bacterium]|nr:hypothetical protein [Clostridiales bacterium]